MIDLVAKLEAIHRGLDAVEDETKYLDIDILRRLGRGVVSASKSRYRSLLSRRSGTMYRGIKAVTWPRKRMTMVSNVAADERTKVRYPFVLAHGATIAPKHKKALTFKIGDKWVRTRKTVTLPVFDWIERPGNQYMWSNKADDDIEKVVLYAIEKLKKKGVLA